MLLSLECIRLHVHECWRLRVEPRVTKYYKCGNVCSRCEDADATISCNPLHCTAQISVGAATVDVSFPDMAGWYRPGHGSGKRGLEPVSADGSRRRRQGDKGEPANAAPQPARVRTVKEIAAIAKVSVATVSRALQRPELVSEATRLRIHEVVKRLGYTPNALARNLRTARTRLVIALLPDIANPFFSEVIRGIEQVAHENGYSVLLGETQGSLVREQAYADMIAARQADGIITMSPRVPAIPIDGRLPVVNACEYVKDNRISSVYIDNVAAAGAAVDYLVTLGHRDIAFIAGPSSSPICVDREQGYQLALQRAKIP
ncbi:MAG TPA: LacI family DNA-binding transcriptional regulator, partial [Pinirhizobacter sp.]|nr:LacI family DNA-binding transcriptional regulator [Pinirhizobacter sp.]